MRTRPQDSGQPRVVAGRVAAGGQRGGAEFSSAKTSAGVVAVTFNRPFQGIPAVAVGLSQSPRAAATLYSETPRGFVLYTWNQAGTLEDTAFSFVAVEVG